MTKGKHKEVRVTLTRKAPHVGLRWYGPKPIDDYALSVCYNGPHTYFEIPSNQRSIDLIVSTNPRYGWRLRKDLIGSWGIGDSEKQTSFYSEVDEWIGAFARSVRGRPIYLSAEIDDDEVFKDNIQVDVSMGSLRIVVELKDGERTFMRIDGKVARSLGADDSIVDEYIKRNEV